MHNVCSRRFLIGDAHPTCLSLKQSQTKLRPFSAQPFNPLPPKLCSKPSLQNSSPETSEFLQNSSFKSEARFGFSSKKAVQSTKNQPLRPSNCHFMGIEGKTLKITFCTLQKFYATTPLAFVLCRLFTQEHL